MPTGLEYFQTADSETLKRYREQWQTDEQQSLNLLQSLADRFSAGEGTPTTAEGITTEFHQIAGGPGRKICEFAQSEDIDLIVMGHREISALNKFLLGSISNYVLHHAPCSVLMNK